MSKSVGDCFIDAVLVLNEISHDQSQPVNMRICAAAIVIDLWEDFNVAADPYVPAGAPQHDA